MSEWISINDRLPDAGFYLVAGRMLLDIDIGYYSPNRHRWDLVKKNDTEGLVTHWQPLPAPPEVSDD